MIMHLSRLFASSYKNTISYLVSHTTYSAFLLVAIVGIFALGVFSQQEETQDVYQVKIGAIEEIVSVTGKVTASKDAKLAFQTTGAVVYVGAKEGDTVKKGKILATLEGGDARAQLLQAEASLANAEATLGQLRQGARPEELALKEQVVENSKATLDQTHLSLPDTIQNVNAVTSDVIKNKFSNLFIFNSGIYTLGFSSCNQKAQSEIEVKRTELENKLAAFQVSASTVGSISSNEKIDAVFQESYLIALATNDLVGNISNLLLATCSLSNSSLDSYRTTLSLVKTSMNTLFSDISTKRSALLSSKNTYQQALKDYELLKAGTDPYRIKAQAAQVAQAEAQVVTAKTALQKTIITAPFDGIINDIAISVGETVTLGKTVVSMQSSDSYEIESKVPEIDIPKITINNPVEITLDAYSISVPFKGVVTRINPSAEIEGGVPMYRVVIAFEGEDDRIKQGMSANIRIVTKNKQQALLVPAKVVQIISKEKGRVWVIKNGIPESKEVQLGIRGEKGEIEIINGVLEGDVLVMPQLSLK